jgi:hypothetical protein
MIILRGHFLWRQQLRFRAPAPNCQSTSPIRPFNAEGQPLFDDLEEWLHAQLPKISSKSPLAKAIRYALGRMPKTRPYLDNGFLELDTDVVEQPFSQPVFGFGGFSRQASTIRA